MGPRIGIVDVQCVGPMLQMRHFTLGGLDTGPRQPNFFSKGNPHIRQFNYKIGQIFCKTSEMNGQLNKSLPASILPLHLSTKVSILTSNISASLKGLLVMTIAWLNSPSVLGLEAVSPMLDTRAFLP